MKQNFLREISKDLIKDLHRDLCRLDLIVLVWNLFEVPAMSFRLTDEGDCKDKGIANGRGTCYGPHRGTIEAQ
jgi:hypothetical protein